MVGLETAFSIAYMTMVKSGLITLATLIDRMATRPAEIGRFAGHGRLADGAPANFILVDLAQEWEVDRAALHSKSRNTPFHAMRLPGQVMKTFHNGALVFDREVGA